MSEYGDLVKAKCDAFADRVIRAKAILHSRRLENHYTG